MTEDQAAVCWCPFTRFVTNQITKGSSIEFLVTGNRQTLTPELPVTSRCIGSQCSQWKWRQKRVGKFITETSTVHGDCGAQS